MAATTKLSMSEQILRMLSSFDRSRAEQVDQREVILLIDQYVNKKAEEDYYKFLKVSKDKSPNIANVTVFKGVIVQYEESTDRAYCDLPAAYIQLIDDKGIYSVSPMKDLSSQFIITRANSLWAYGNNPAGELQTNNGCYVEENRIYFYENILNIGIEELMIRQFIASSSSISSTAPYPISAEDEMDVVLGVYAILAQVNQTPKDKVNDNRKAE